MCATVRNMSEFDNTDKPLPYDEMTLSRMVSFAAGLNEVDRRAYAAVEAYKLGRGGVKGIAGLFGMSPETIKRGREDLDDSSRVPSGRLRAVGAGRKGVFAEQPGLEKAFDDLISSHIAGDPMNENVIWTDLQPALIAAKLQELGFTISESAVRVRLKKKLQKTQTPQSSRHRHLRSRRSQRAV